LHSIYAILLISIYPSYLSDWLSIYLIDYLSITTDYLSICLFSMNCCTLPPADQYPVLWMWRQ